MFKFEITFTLNGYETQRVTYEAECPADAMRYFRRDHIEVDPEVKQVALVLHKSEWDLRAGNVICSVGQV